MAATSLKKGGTETKGWKSKWYLKKTKIKFKKQLEEYFAF